MRKATALTVRYIIGVAVAAVVLVPIVYGVMDGFKTNGDLVGNASLLPKEWVFTNYRDVLQSTQFWQQVWNSTVIAIFSVGIVVSFSALAAFVIARMKFRGREAVYTLFTLGLLFPPILAILPLFVLLRTVGLTDNPLGVALPQAAFGLPITIIILRPFFQSIPNELEDASKIDGCSTIGFFWHILLPLSRPALATVMVLALVGTWNDFNLPLIILNSTSNWTLPLGVQNFSTEHNADWARILAFTSLSMLPAVIFYAIAERQIVAGLTAGSVKG